MKTLTQFINEAKSTISFDDFYYALEDYVYDNGTYNLEVGKHVLLIKDIFGKETIKCKTFDIKWIYPLRLSGREIGARKDRGGFEYISAKSSVADSNLRDFFGEDNLNKIYKFIKQK